MLVFHCLTSDVHSIGKSTDGICRAVSYSDHSNSDTVRKCRRPGSPQTVVSPISRRNTTSKWATGRLRGDLLVTVSAGVYSIGCGDSSLNSNECRANDQHT